MKTRIVFEHGRYYPQIKGWLLGWKNFYEPGYPQLDGLQGDEVVCFATEQQAKDYLFPPEPKVCWESA